MDAIALGASLIMILLATVVVRAVITFVPRGRRLVVTRRGRASTVKGPGLAVVLPGVDSAVMTPHEPDYLDILWLAATTADGVTVSVNGLALASWAQKHPSIVRVHYPGLSTHPDHAYARRVLAGFGGMVGLELKGGVRAAERMLKRLKLIAHAPSLAGVESLVSEPRLTSHRNLSPEARAAVGIPDGFLRLSCGLEDGEDIIEDLRQALGKEA